MDVSSISTSLSNRAESLQRQGRIAADYHKDDHRDRRHCKGIGRCGHALSAFKQELRVRLNARFDAKYSVVERAYTEAKAPDTSEKIATAALADAKQISAESPPKAASSLVKIRAVVRETASFVRETLGENEDYAELDEAVAKVDGALGKLESAASRNVESSASVLAVDTRSKQRSTIRIRTQEGDTVRFSLRSSSRTSASDSAVSKDGRFAAVTEIELSSKSRLSLRVEGDLNDAELAAIQNVFAQAESIANEFFDGDIGAAFNLAQGFEFDTEQLARVKLGFQSRSISRASYTETVRTEKTPASGNASVAEVEQLAAREVPAIAQSQESRPVNEVVEATEVAAEPEQDGTTPIAPDGLSDFFDMLGAFLRSIGDGFAAESSRGSFQLHYSQSFKLEILKAVIHTIATPQLEQSAANAATIVEAVEEGQSA